MPGCTATPSMRTCPPSPSMQALTWSTGPRALPPVLTITSQAASSRAAAACELLRLPGRCCKHRPPAPRAVSQAGSCGPNASWTPPGTGTPSVAVRHPVPVLVPVPVRSPLGAGGFGRSRCRRQRPVLRPVGECLPRCKENLAFGGLLSAVPDVGAGPGRVAAGVWPRHSRWADCSVCAANNCFGPVGSAAPVAMATAVPEEMGPMGGSPASTVPVSRKGGLPCTAQPSIAEQSAGAWGRGRQPARPAHRPRPRPGASGHRAAVRRPRVR